MAHCIVSLTVAERFEGGDTVRLEQICTRGKNIKNDNSVSDGSKKGIFVTLCEAYDYKMVFTIEIFNRNSIVLRMR